MQDKKKMWVIMNYKLYSSTSLEADTIGDGRSATQSSLQVSN